MIDLQQARKAAAERYLQIGRRIADEAGVRQFDETPGNALYGRAYTKQQRIKAPTPTTRNRLYIFAHECGHVALGHRYRQPVWREEYEAERWAHDALRRHGVAVPKKMTASAKAYIASKIRRALRRGAKRIDPAVARWAGVDVDIERKISRMT